MSRWEIGGDWSCRPSCASEPGLVEGATLTLVEAPGGLVLLTRQQLRALVRADLAELDLVGELLAERRADDASDSAL